MKDEDEPSIISIPSNRQLCDIVDQFKAILFCINNKHSWVWKKDVAGNWWDLNSVHYPRCLSVYEALCQLSQSDIIIYDCTKLIRHIVTKIK